MASQCDIVIHPSTNSTSWKERGKGEGRKIIPKKAIEKRQKSVHGHDKSHYPPPSAFSVVKDPTIQSHNLRPITNAGTSGSFSRVKCSCRRRDDMLTKLATDRTEMDAVVSRLIVAWFWVA